MIILRKGEERQGYRVLMVKAGIYNETKFAVQYKTRFLYLFAKWKFVEDNDGNVKLFDSNKNAHAYINFRNK